MKIVENKKEFSIQIGDTVRVSDPCYGMDIDRRCVQTIDNVAPGVYECLVEKTELDSDFFPNDIRVSSIEVRNSEYDNVEISEHVGQVCVDSGMCGIFDASYFAKKSKNNDWVEELSDKAGHKYARENRNFRTFVDSSYYKPEFGESLKNGFERMKDPDVVEIASEYKIGSSFKKAVENRESLLVIAVYSGDATLYNAVMNYIKSHESCEVVFSSEMYASADGKGIASDSGIGDGTYDVYVGRNESGMVVGIRLDYFGNERERCTCNIEDSMEER